PIRFYVIGGPIYQTRGSQLTEQQLRVWASGLHNQVGFIGFQTDTAPVYRALDIVVHASTRPEPFGLTVAEAMACGRATIVANAGGAAELFHHDDDAIGVPPGDVGALAQALDALVRDANLRESLGAAARRTAVARFDRRRLG